MDQFTRARGHDTAAHDDAGARPAEDLDEAVPDALHLGARVAQERQLDDAGLDLARVHVGLRVADGGDLRVGEDVGGDRLQVQRGHRVAQEVVHRDPALHGGDRGQREDAGHVAGRVHAGAEVRETLSVQM